MNFAKFPVSTTTIFPVANSHAGGQLLTERNQLSRPTVANHSNIPYVCGPSYTHSLNDFEINTNGSNSSHILYISGGSAIVHGHFLHLDNSSHTAIAIDLAEANSSSASPLRGHLCVGLRAMYANENTAAASLRVEDDENFYQGIQVVILPYSQFRLPENNGSGSYTPEDQVTAHLKLGEFVFNNNIISDLTPNGDRHRCLDADKINDIDALIASTYVKRTGLDPKKIYSMSGESNGTWVDTTDSTIVWDNDPQLRSDEDSVKRIWLKDGAVSGSLILDEAAVRYDSDDDQLKMILPHKQPRGMKNTSGEAVYYEPKEIPIPPANRATGDGGVLNRYWVNFLNGLDDKISTMYRMPGGKMRRFIEILTDKSELPAPPIAYYKEQNRDAAYYDNRLQYSFNLLQTQVAQLNSEFLDFQSKLESEWKTAVTADVTATLSTDNSAVQANLDKLRNDLSSFQGALSELTGGISESSNTFSSYLEIYQSLNSRVTTLENQWTSPRSTGSDDEDIKQNSEIEDLQLKVIELEQKLTSDISNVQNLINTVSSIVTSLQNSLYGSGVNNGDINDVTLSVEQLRSQYDYLYDAIHDLYDGITAEVEKASSSMYDKLFSALKSVMESQIAALADQYNVTAEWTPGDYVLVAQDRTVVSSVTSDESTFPSTMYVVVPGMTPVDSKYIASYYDVYTTDLSTPINRVNSSSGTSDRDTFSDAINTYDEAVATVKRQVPASFVYGYELGGNDVTEVASESDMPDVYNSTEMLEELYRSDVMLTGVRGTPGKDYFVLRYRYPLTGDSDRGDNYTDEMSGKTYTGIQYQRYRWVSVFFTLNLVNDKVELDVDNPIILSGGTPYAEEARVGGFLNVGSDVYGGGYVSRDEEGHLRLNDFELLAAGVSAYQLGEDRVEGSGLDISELQDIFDQYVNQRIAFPNDAQLYKAAEKGLATDKITIELNIGSTSEGTLNIYDIDSRFHTCLELKISGSATENVLINISNCQRLKLTLDPTSNPTIFIKNVCLYYDADILDRVANIEGLTLWSDDPNIEIDGMTVIYQGKLEAKGTERFWNYAIGNDNCYAYALRQITFASNGTIIGVGIAVTDNTTSGSIPTGEAIFASTFTLPQSIGLAYPVTRLTKQLKVTGNFVTAYSGSDGYTVKNTSFTILTQKYLKYTDIKEFISGVISFYTRTSKVRNSIGVDEDTLMSLQNEFAIDGWESGSYHIFYGGAVD